MAILIDGKQLAKDLRLQIKEEAAKLPRRPGLAVILVGEDPASQVYVRNKEKDCVQCGFSGQTYRMDDCGEEELLALIERLNNDPLTDGILVQLPLPKHIDEGKVLRAISPAKDVDCFHPENVGEMMVGDPICWPCTPFGVMELLREYGISAAGKHCVVLGRSNIVGKPMSMLMMQKQYGDSTVTVLHSHSQNLAEECRQADILIAAIGSPAFVTADMVKPGAVVIDVGTTRVPDATRPSGFRLQGDVDFQTVSPLCSAITPVPGGVGPMTICMLMLNTLQAYKQRA